MRLWGWGKWGKPRRHAELSVGGGAHALLPAAPSLPTPGQPWLLGRDAVWVWMRADPSGEVLNSWRLVQPRARKARKRQQGPQRLRGMPLSHPGGTEGLNESVLAQSLSGGAAQAWVQGTSLHVTTATSGGSSPLTECIMLPSTPDRVDATLLLALLPQTRHASCSSAHRSRHQNGGTARVAPPSCWAAVHAWLPLRLCCRDRPLSGQLCSLGALAAPSLAILRAETTTSASHL